MRTTIYILSILTILACKNETSRVADKTNQLETTSLPSEAAITLSMEGKTYTFLQKDMAPQKVDFESDSLLFVFQSKASPVSINLNFFNSDIVENGSATYSIPDANAQNTKVDLNFHDKDRDASRINKRIIFKKGTITIQELTKNNLKMDFEGEGSGMTERNRSFPISGTIDLDY